MRSTIAIVLAAMLASSMAFAETNTNSGAGAAGKPAADRSSDDEIGATLVKPEWHQSRSK